MNRKYKDTQGAKITVNNTFVTVNKANSTQTQFSRPSPHKESTNRNGNSGIDYSCKRPYWSRENFNSNSECQPTRQKPNNSAAAATTSKTVTIVKTTVGTNQIEQSNWNRAIHQKSSGSDNSWRQQPRRPQWSRENSNSNSQYCQPMKQIPNNSADAHTASKTVTVVKTTVVTVNNANSTQKQISQPQRSVWHTGAIPKTRNHHSNGNACRRK